MRAALVGGEANEFQNDLVADQNASRADLGVKPLCEFGKSSVAHPSPDGGVDERRLSEWRRLQPAMPSSWCRHGPCGVLATISTASRAESSSRMSLVWATTSATVILLALGHRGAHSQPPARQTGELEATLVGITSAPRTTGPQPRARTGTKRSKRELLVERVHSGPVGGNRVSNSRASRTCTAARRFGVMMAGSGAARGPAPPWKYWPIGHG